MNYLIVLQTLPPAAPDVSLVLLLPEIIVSLAGVLVMLIDALTRREDRPWLTGGVSLAGLIGAAAAAVWLWRGLPGLSQTAYNGMIVLDPMRLAFTLVFIVVAALTVLLSMLWVEWERLPAGEFQALLLFATVGMMLMAAGGDLVILFLGLELLSISTYVMAGFRRIDLRSNESSIKYFILGSFSSAFLLYGIALVYGGSALGAGDGFTAGTTNLAELARRIETGTAYPALVYAGAALLLVGFGFKIATAPFHVWTPDVYEGAPTPVTAFMAAGPKAAGFAAFMRAFLVGFPLVVAGAANKAAPVHDAWVNALYVLAILTMTVGNLAALVQTNVKRMLAYSSIAHAGYALVGFVAAGATADQAQQADAVGAVIFYLLGYAVMNLGAFAVVTLIARHGDRRTELEDYNGIGFRAPVLAFTLTLFLLSLLGVPLTAGFMGKVLVFRSALNLAGLPNGAKYTALVVVGVLNTAISTYYYLRLVVVMFFRERTTQWVAPRVPAAIALTLVLTVVGVFYLGLFPGRVLDAFRSSRQAVSQLRR